MALYHFSVRNVSRGKGQMVVASAAYISGQRIFDSYYNKIHDYTSKSGVIFTEILTPEYVPERLTDRETLWNEVEHVERNNKAPPGETMAFKLGDEEGFRWVGAYEISADDLLDGKEGKPTETKLQRGTKLIYELLADGNAVTIRELDEKAKAQGISQRTMREARSRMKEELDYRMNEKQENTIRLKKQGRMGDGRILE